jgi:hypothetical protein
MIIGNEEPEDEESGQCFENVHMNQSQGSNTASFKSTQEAKNELRLSDAEANATTSRSMRTLQVRRDLHTRFTCDKNLNCNDSICWQARILQQASLYGAVSIICFGMIRNNLLNNDAK